MLEVSTELTQGRRLSVRVGRKILHLVVKRAVTTRRACAWGPGQWAAAWSQERRCCRRDSRAQGPGQKRDPVAAAWVEEPHLGDGMITCREEGTRSDRRCPYGDSAGLS